MEPNDGTKNGGFGETGNKPVKGNELIFVVSTKILT